MRCTAEAVPAEAAAAAGAAAEITAEPDYSFQKEHLIAIDTFVRDWHLYEKAVREFSIDPNWPGQRLICNAKTLKNALLGLVTAALLQLSSTIDENIQPEKVTKSVSKPAVEVYAFLGHHEQKANRS